MYNNIIQNLRDLYLKDSRPWLVGFSGGKDSTMVAALVFNAILSIPPGQRDKPITVISTDTRAEIPAIVEMLEGTLKRMRRFSHKMGLNIEVVLLKPPPEQSF
jgi:DNA sulfur modification protein DndC